MSINELEQKRQLRTAVLKKVYELTNGNVKTAAVNGGQLTAQLDIRDGKTDDFRNAVAYLDSKGLITTTWLLDGSPSFIKLTYDGLVEIEEAIADPGKRTEHLSPLNVLYINQAIGSNIQQGTTDSSQVMTLSAESLTKIKEFLATLSQSMPALSLDESDKRELEAEAKTIQAQVESPKPKAPIIKEGLVSIRSVLEKAGGSLLAVELLKYIDPLLHMLGLK